MAMTKYRAAALLALLWPLALPLQATPTQALPGVPVAMTPLQDPAHAWSSMAPSQQRELRARYAAWQALSDDERTRIRRAAVTVAALPAAQQTQLRLRFAAQDQLHRDGWRLGPVLGALYPKLQPLFGYLPPEQRGPALALLRGSSEAQLAQLALLSQRTPPQDRDAVRQQLLALAPDARAAWLQEKVGH